MESAYTIPKRFVVLSHVLYDGWNKTISSTRNVGICFAVLFQFFYSIVRAPLLSRYRRRRYWVSVYSRMTSCAGMPQVSGRVVVVTQLTHPPTTPTTRSPLPVGIAWNTVEWRIDLEPQLVDWSWCWKSSNVAAKTASLAYHVFYCD